MPTFVEFQLLEEIVVFSGKDRFPKTQIIQIWELPQLNQNTFREFFSSEIVVEIKLSELFTSFEISEEKVKVIVAVIRHRVFGLPVDNSLPD